jgi:hypothetical protein
MRLYTWKHTRSAAALAVLALAAPSRAEPPPAQAGASPPSEAEKLYRDATVAIAANQLAVAEQKLAKAAELLPDNGPILQKQAELAEKKGASCQAAKGFEKAASLASKQGRTAIAEALSQRAREQGAACRGTIRVEAGGTCAESAATIRITAEDGSPAPSEASAPACKHSFSVSALGLSNSSPGKYTVTVEQPGNRPETRHVTLHGKEDVTLSVDLLPKEAAPDPKREERRRALFTGGVAATVTAAAAGVAAAVIAATVYNDDPFFVAVPVLSGAAIAIGATGFVMVVTNLPSSSPASTRDASLGQGQARSRSAAETPAAHATPMLGLGLHF